MKVGAVIVAAGMSTRMKQCKQRMKIGAFTMAQQVIMNFKAAGVDEIVVVTGYQAEQIEHEIWNLGVTILRNPDYATTQMFDSAKLGLSYLQNYCDRILFCPVDVPLFSSATVKMLLDADGALIFPVCRETIGHPIILDSKLVPLILQYKGQRGLKGALDSLEIKPVRISIEDEGILMDADTKEDFKQLTALYDTRMMKAKQLGAIAIPLFAARNEQMQKGVV
ncbi:MAG: nucleotidyltransferase family protein [Lachnospiraceae bacterium]|nr:nucleotidyltransferase family protein [Lachnospiraceae bacterium]